MRISALDYTKLAAFYDDYCTFDGDVEFFRREVETTRGLVLELMAGTGRISRPLLECGANLLCVDNSLAMLSVLGQKAAGGPGSATPLCADVRELPLDRCFDLVLLPFQGLTELPARDDRSKTFRSVSRLLADSGRFVCTSHNPRVRLRSVDSKWREIGEFERSTGGAIRVLIRGRFDEDAQLVIGEQRIVLEDACGGSETLDFDLRFSLVPVEEILEMAAENGLRVARLLGDYLGNDFQPDESPVIIAVLEKLTGPVRESE